jgi:hypothetical protein
MTFLVDMGLSDTLEMRFRFLLRYLMEFVQLDIDIRLHRMLSQLRNINFEKNR